MKQITPKAKYLTMFTLAVAGLMSNSLSHAGTYYNCANATGCIPVSDLKTISNYSETKYPIVLAHGLGGWTRLLCHYSLTSILENNPVSIYRKHVNLLKNEGL